MYKLLPEDSHHWTCKKKKIGYFHELQDERAPKEGLSRYTVITMAHPKGDENSIDIFVLRV